MRAIFVWTLGRRCNQSTQTGRPKSGEAAQAASASEPIFGRAAHPHAAFQPGRQGVLDAQNQEGRRFCHQADAGCICQGGCFVGCPQIASKMAYALQDCCRGPAWLFLPANTTITGPSFCSSAQGARSGRSCRRLERFRYHCVRGCPVG